MFEKTTLWLWRRLLFVLSLIERLLLFIGARQPGQPGRQSYADHIEGLHYLEASSFLFSLKGRVRESISLAKESDGGQKGGREGGRSTEEEEKKSVCTREKEGASLKASASLRAARGSGDKLHPNNGVFTDCAVALC